MSKVFAFEPLPAIHAVLSANLALHGVDAEVFACGLSNAEREVDFQYFPNTPGLSGYSGADDVADTVKAVLRAQQDIDLADIDTVVPERLQHETVHSRVRTLSSVIDERNVSHIDLLKIDVERAELDVLEGIEPPHWPLIRQIVMEAHDLDGRVARITELLQRRGFHVAVEQSP